MEYKNLAPSPASLIQSLRDIGYSIQTAVADIIDNSITAEASLIQILFSWNSGVPWLGIVDNGCGMASDELLNAMRFGSMHPLEVRDQDDLGRFGLGMKTASFSQCRCFTVLSKKEGKVACCQWDMDYLSKNDNSSWQVGVLSIENIKNHNYLNTIYSNNLADNQSGTIILWENIDRISSHGTQKEKEKYFNSSVDDIRKHLSIVFHRFISPDPGSKKIIITMNSDELDAFNPFNPNHLATQELQKQQIVLDGEKINVQPYILPHHTKASKEEYERYSGETGYLQNQGFYIYRNKRLIIKGTWFRLLKKEELNKLIRIKVDIPNTLDHLWKIDVKKSQAVPPENIKKELKQVISKIEFAGRKVYRQKGQKIIEKVRTPAWNRRHTHNKIIYEINRDYPLIKEISDGLSTDQNNKLKLLLNTLESSYPAEIFFSDKANHPEKIEKPAWNESKLSSLLDIYISSLKENNTNDSEILDIIMHSDPFVSQIDLSKKLLSTRGYFHG